MNYRTYVTDESGELLDDGQVRLESGQVINEDEQPYFDSVKNDLLKSGEQLSADVGALSERAINWAMENGDTPLPEEKLHTIDDTPVPEISMEELTSGITIPEESDVKVGEDVRTDSGTDNLTNITSVGTVMGSVPQLHAERKTISADKIARETKQEVDINAELDRAQANAEWSSLLPKRNTGVSPASYGLQLAMNFANNITSDKPIIGDKWTSLSYLWDNNTLVGRGMNYMKYDYGFLRGGAMSSVFGEEDVEYSKRSTKHEDILDLIELNKLPPNVYKQLEDAKSREHEASILEGLRETEYKNNLIGRSYDMYSGGLSEANIAMAAASILDVETLTLGTFGTLAKLTKAGELNAALAGSINMTLNKAIYDIDPNVSKGEAWSYALLGAIDMPFIYKMGATDLKPMYTTINAMGTPDFLKRAELATSNAKNRYGRKAESHMSLPEVIDDIIDTEVVGTKLSNPEIKKRIMSPMERKYREVEEGLRAATPEEIIAKGKRDAKFAGDVDAAYELAKVEIKNRRLVANSSGFKKLQDKIRGINEKLKAEDLTLKARNKLEKEYQIERQRNLDYNLIANELKTNLDKFKAHVEWLGKEGKADLADEMLEFYKGMHAKGNITDIEMARLITQKNEVKYPKIKMSKNADGTYSVVSKDGKKTKSGKTIPAAVVATIAATSALEAGDFDYRDYALPSVILLMGAMAFVGRKAIVAKNFTNKFDDTVKQSDNMDRTRGWRAKVEDGGTKLRTRITETIKPLQDDLSEPFSKAVSRIYFNPVDGSKPNVEALKDQHYKGMWHVYNKKMGDNFKTYLVENNVEALDKISNVLDYSNGMRYAYEKKVMEAIEEGLHLDSPSIQKAVEIIQETKKNFITQIKGSGMKFKHLNLEDTETWLPRYKKGSLSTVLRSISPDSYDSVVTAFAKTLTRVQGNPKLGITKEQAQITTARTYLDFAKHPNTPSNHGGFSSVADIEVILQSKGLHNILDANEIADMLGIGAESWGRTKARIHIDKSLFPKQGVSVFHANGSEMKIKMDDMFESSSTEVMHKYITELSGHLAFADAGFETVGKALETARTAVNPLNQARMEKDIGMLSGKSNIDMSDPANQFWADVRNLTLATKMPLSALSLTQELLTTMQRVRGGSWIKTFDDLSKEFLDMGQDSLMVQTMLLTGRAMNRYGATYGAIKGMDEFGVGTAGAGDGIAKGIFSKTGELSRDFILHQAGLVKGSDFLEAVNLHDTAMLFYDFVNGKTKFMDYEKVTYGITPEFEKFLQSLNLQLNNKGHVKAVNMDAWSREERVKYMSVVDNIMQKRIQHARMGTTPGYLRDTMLGRVMGTLLSFPLSAFTNIGTFQARGMMAGDVNAYMQSGLWFAGGAIAAIMRWEIQGKEYDAEDILYASLLSHPSMGFAAVESAFANPAPMDTIQRFTEIYGRN